MRVCKTEECEESLEGRHPATEYCRTCSTARAKVQKAAGGKVYRARKAGTVTKKCACGAEIPASQVRCAPCRKVAEKEKEQRKRAAKKKKLADKRATLPPQGKRVRIARPTDAEKEAAAMARVGCVQFTREQIEAVQARGEIAYILDIPHAVRAAECGIF